MPAIVNSAVIAEALNLTPRRIEQLVLEGMPRLGRGKYDLWPCAHWYIRYLQAAIERRATDAGEGGTSNITEEKKRLIRIQADTALVEYQQKIGELIPAHLVDDKFVTFAGTVHDRFLSLPSKVAKRLAGESEEVIRLKLYESIRDLLNGMSAGIVGKKVANKEAKEKSRSANFGKKWYERDGQRPAAKVTRSRSTKTRRRP